MLSTTRLQFIDTLRGLVMVLMTLDHVRDFWGPTPFDPVDPGASEPAWYLTRWLTHFCAPVFVFLAGTSAHFTGARLTGPGALSRYLAVRGLWLVGLEFLVVVPSWMFFPVQSLFAQVIWALGMSMLALSVLCLLPGPVLGLLALAVLLGHNAFDGLKPEDFGAQSWLWTIAHVPGYVPLSDSGFGVYFAYPLLPWIALMAAGYAFAPWLFAQAERRRSRLLSAGLGLVATFLVLRAFNTYGDASLWAVQARGAAYTLMSFFNLSKYPPSLLFLCATLGLALVLAAWLSVGEGRNPAWLRTFGRVPLFFYLLHVPLIHALADIRSWFEFGVVNWYTQWPVVFPVGYQPRLWLVYLVWVLVVAMLYLPCRWYDRVKREHRDSLLRFI
ncbi:MAG: DUF1624 domain-containing protein [Gammaproteobacteria bacterium]|nr:DUF1624 domain-containing protein [Gammaproteobacteria bacterium]